MFKAVNIFFSSTPAYNIKAAIMHAPQKEKNAFIAMK